MEPNSELEPPYEMISQAFAPLNADSASLASLDGLIDDLANMEADSEPHISKETSIMAGSGPPVPDEMLNTDLVIGLQDAEILARRRRFGMNELQEEKRNHFLTFLMFFVGPIQFVMEVSWCITCPIESSAPCPCPLSLFCLAHF